MLLLTVTLLPDRDILLSEQVCILLSVQPTHMHCDTHINTHTPTCSKSSQISEIQFHGIIKVFPESFKTENKKNIIQIWSFCSFEKKQKQNMNVLFSMNIKYWQENRRNRRGATSEKEFIFIAPQMAYLFFQMVHKVFKDSEKKPSEGR